MNIARSIAIAIAATAGAIGIYLGIHAGLLWPAIVVICALFAIAIAVQAKATFKNNGDILRPGLWITLAYFIVFGYGGISLLLCDPSRHAEDMLLLLIGFGGLQLGLMLADSPTPKPADSVMSWTPSRFRTLVACWLAAGFAIAILYFLAIGGFPILMESPEYSRVDPPVTGGGYYRFVIYSLPVCCMFIWIDHLAKRLLPCWVALAATVVTTLVFILLGNRAPLICMIVMAALIYLGFSKSENRGRTIIALSLAALLAVVAFSAIGTWRIMRDDKLSRYPEIRRYADDGDYAGLAASRISNYLETGVRNFSLVVETVPDHYPYRYGASYLDPLFTALPGKQYTLDMQLKQALGRKFAGGGLVPTMPGEAYVNFGAIGVFMVPAVLGFFLVWLHRRWRNGDSPGDGLLFLFVLYYLSIHMISGVLASSIFSLEAVVSIIVFDRILKGRAKPGEKER